MFTYEFRVGHVTNWSTAQGRFGPALRVAGVQHPAPPLLGTVSSLPATVSVAAPYATPVFGGRNLLPAGPRTQLWALLYAQVTQARQGQRNVLLARRELSREGLRVGRRCRPGWPGRYGAGRHRGDPRALALPANSPLSVVVVEMLPDIGELADPLAGTSARSGSCVRPAHGRPRRLLSRRGRALRPGPAAGAAVAAADRDCRTPIRRRPGGS